MKKLILALLLLPLSALAAEGGGNEGGHGGSPEAVEFVSLAHKLYNELSKPEYKSLLDETNFSLKKFKHKIKKAIVIVKPAEEMILVRDGFKDELPAINFPKFNRIHLHHDLWSQEKPIDEKLALVLHEYMGLMEIELDVTSVSALYMQPIRAIYYRTLEEQRLVPAYIIGPTGYQQIPTP